MEERHLAKVEVAGSKPVSRSNPLAQADDDFAGSRSNLRRMRDMRVPARWAHVCI